jgi:hypothetical protein
MKDKNNLKYDFVRVLIVIIVIAIISYFIKFDIASLKYANDTTTFLGIFVSLLGFIITAITILLMFDSDKNKNLIKLKEAGYYNQMLERFVSTTFVLSLGMIIFILLILSNNFILGKVLLYLINLLIIFLLLLALLRIYRSLKILHLIYKLVYAK